MPTTSEPLTRRRWPALVAFALAAVLALIFAGLRTTTVRTLALGAPNQSQVALVRVGSRVCEGPVRSHRPIDAIGIWGASVIGPAVVGVDVQDVASGRTLGSGVVHAGTTAARHTARLTRAVPGDAATRICLTGRLNTFALQGSAALAPGVATTGARPGSQFSLVLLDDRRSLAAWLPTAFARASLFKPAWVGSWTFWVLLVAVASAFGLGVAATLSAASSDDDQTLASSQRTADQ